MTTLEPPKKFYPAPFIWKGGVMHPALRFVALCQRQYEEGQEYILVREDVRSKRNHNHLFAAIATAWKNLPEDELDNYKSPEHLRKKALIATGFANENTIVCNSPADAKSLVAILTSYDDCAVTSVRFNVVKHWTAQSQSKKAMGGKVFKESKEAVLTFVSKLIGTDVTTLLKNVEMDE